MAIRDEYSCPFIYINTPVVAAVPTSTQISLLLPHRKYSTPGELRFRGYCIHSIRNEKESCGVPGLNPV
jgi:hypothetical protein